MGTRFVSVLSLLALSLNATVALAAEPTTAPQPYGNRDEEATLDLSNAYEPEAVYVTRIAANVEDGNVTGSFTVLNTEETLVTGLQYRLELRGVGEYDGLPYMIDVVRASVALASNEQKTLLFATNLPNVPAGRYDLRVQMLTAKGRSLGWQDTAVVVTDDQAASDFVRLLPGTIGIAAYGDELLPPLSGPNVDPSSDLTLRGMAENLGNRDSRVKPVVEIFDFNAARVSLASFEFSTLNIGAGESIPLNMPITAEAAPGVYMAHVTLKDADTMETISTIAQYRFVVKGEDADIVSVSIENMGTKGGDWAYGTVDLAGSADALTITTATLRVHLLDDEGVVGSIEVPNIELSDAILTAKIRIPLERDLVGNPTIDASLLSVTNATYDHATYAGTLTPAQLASLTQDQSVSNWVAWHGLARISFFAFLAVLIGYALFSLGLRIRGGNVAFLRSATAAFLLLTLVTQVTSGFAAGGGGIEVLTPKNGSDVFNLLGNRPIVALFVNSPVHNQANNFCNRQVTLSYRLEYGVCENQIAYARVLGRVTKNGGKLTTYDPAGTQWETVHNQAFTSALCTQQVCWQTDNFTGTVNLNAVDANATDATLQLVAKYGKNIAIPDSSFDRNDPFIRVGWVHALNVHLQCTPQVGCIEILKETFDTQNNRTTPVPQFTFKLDGNQTAVNDANGRAIFQNVTPGTHTISEIVPNGWENFLVTPQNGTVQVAAGNNCAAVVIKNRLLPQFGCIEILKEGFDTDNNVVTPLPSFSFKLDGAQTVQTNTQGRATFQNVTPGTHTVSEMTASGWTLFNTTPTNGAVNVTAGTNCAAVVFKNRQNSKHADLQLQKTGPTTAMRGQNVTYTLVAKNNGPQSAPNTIIRDVLPAGTTFVAAQSDSRCQMQGNSVACNIGTLTNGQQISLQLTLNVSNTYTAATLVNQAAVLSDLQDRNLQNNQSTATSQVPQPGCIEILKEGFDAMGSRLATVPPFEFILDGSGSVNVHTDSTGRAKFSNVAPGTHTVSEKTMSGWTLFNTTPQNGIVNVSTGTNCAAVVFKNRQSPQGANVSVAKTGPATSVRGGNFTYSITVTNAGPATAQNVVVDDPIPASLTNPVVSGQGCVIQNGVVRCTIGTLAMGEQRVITVNVQVPAAVQSCQNTSVTNTATLTSTNDTTPANNTSTVTTQLQCPVTQQADLQIQLTGPSSIVRGNVATYSAVVKNNGPSASPNTIVGYPVPAGTTFNAAQSDSRCTLQNNTIFCNLGTMAVNQQTTLAIALNVTATLICQAGSILNQTAVQGDLQDPNMQNNQASFTTQVTCAQGTGADVSVLKTGPTSIVRGQNITYQLVVSNAGPASASGVTLSDIVPTGLTLITAGSGCTLTNGTINCALGTIATGQSRSLSFTFATQAQTGTCTAGSITNTAIAATSSTDQNAQNNQSSATTQLTCPTTIGKDISIQKTGPSVVTRGDNFSYTLTVTNSGPATATGVVVTDVLPSGLVFVSASAECANSVGTITCQAGTIPATQSRTFTITVSTPAIASCNQASITNTGTATSSGGDNNNANNSSSLTTQINCPNAQLGCIDIIKETFDTNGSVLTPVTQFSFSLDGTRTAVNDSLGRARFENVPVGSHTVTETIPTNWTQMSATPTNGAMNVTPGTCVTVTFKNRQSISTGGWTISKTDNETKVKQGDTLTYRITVRNGSSTRQTNVTIIDTLPDEVEFQDATPNESSENGRTIRWQNQTFEAGETKTYEVEVDVDDDADGTLLNTAEVQGITATDRTDIEDNKNGDVEIDLTKTASTSEVFPGGIIDYTVRIRNTGDSTIENLTVVDQLPADVIIIDDGDADTRSGRRLKWEIDELKDGDEEIFRYRVSVPTYMVAGQVVRNEVCVESDDLDDEECESVTVSVIGIIPTTGASSPSMPNAHLTPIANRNTPSDGTLPFLAVIALAGAATGAGLGFGRKLLFGI